MDELDRSSYAHHVLEQREEELTEQRHELVKRLLAKACRRVNGQW